MSDLKNRIILAFSIIILMGAIFVFYSQPLWLKNGVTRELQLYGHITSFTLSTIPMKNHMGSTVYWRNLSDKPLYITTGFTSCSNTCPVTMSYYQRLAKELEKNAVFSMLTIDPERDSQDVMKSYLGAINPSFVGLIIENEQLLARVTEELKQYVFTSRNGNEVIHSGYIYLIHPNVDGLIIYHQINLNIEEMINDFRKLATLSVTRKLIKGKKQSEA